MSIVVIVSTVVRRGVSIVDGQIQANFKDRNSNRFVRLIRPRGETRQTKSFKIRYIGALVTVRTAISIRIKSFRYNQLRQQILRRIGISIPCLSLSL